MLFRPLIQNSSRYFSRLKRVCRTQTLTSTEGHISSLHSRILGQLSRGSPFVQPDKNQQFLWFFIILREYGSTLYVGLAHTFTPTNTKFQPLLLPTQPVTDPYCMPMAPRYISLAYLIYFRMMFTCYLCWQSV